jgi:hypothetical protein
VQIFFHLGSLILILCEMSLHEDSDLDGGEIPLGPEVTEDLCIHLMSIKGANKSFAQRMRICLQILRVPRIGLMYI